MWSSSMPRKKRRTWTLVRSICLCLMLTPIFLPGEPTTLGMGHKRGHWDVLLCSGIKTHMELSHVPCLYLWCSRLLDFSHLLESITQSVWPAGLQYLSCPTSARILVLGPDTYSTTTTEWNHSPSLVIVCSPGEQAGDYELRTTPEQRWMPPQAWSAPPWSKMTAA